MWQTSLLLLVIILMEKIKQGVGKTLGLKEWDKEVG